MSRDTILAVEDAQDYQLMIKASLERHYDLTVVGSLADANRALGGRTCQLLLLDVNLPDGDGFEYCRDLRERPETRSLPVIFLTARSELEDKLRGFSLGADDYIVKPFEGLELRARVEAKLARERAKTPPEDVVVKGALRLEIPTQRTFLLAEDGARVDAGLTPIEFKILYHLVRNESKVVSREELLSTVWGKETHVFDRATDKHVSSLRQKLGPRASYIETVSRVGYRFTTKPGV